MSIRFVCIIIVFLKSPFRIYIVVLSPLLRIFKLFVGFNLEYYLDKFTSVLILLLDSYNLLLSKIFWLLSFIMVLKD